MSACLFCPVHSLFSLLLGAVLYFSKARNFQNFQCKIKNMAQERLCRHETAKKQESQTHCVEQQISPNTSAILRKNTHFYLAFSQVYNAKPLQQPARFTMTTKITPDMTVLSETLLIPLWAKAVEYERSDALLRAKEAPSKCASRKIWLRFPCAKKRSGKPLTPVFLPST